MENIERKSKRETETVTLQFKVEVGKIKPDTLANLDPQKAHQLRQGRIAREVLKKLGSAEEDDVIQRLGLIEVVPEPVNEQLPGTKLTDALQLPQVAIFRRPNRGHGFVK